MADEAAGFEALRVRLQSNGVELPTDSMHAGEAGVVIAALGLPEEVAGIYARNGPGPSSSIPWIVEELYLYSLHELPGAQEGYRWSGPDQQLLADWAPNCVVVASVLADPFFVDIRRARGPVYFARHGAGKWEAKRVAPSFAKFLEVLAAFEGVPLGDFDSNVWTGVGLRVEFVNAVRARLGQELAGDDLHAFMSAIAA